MIKLHVKTLERLILEEIEKILYEQDSTDFLSSGEQPSIPVSRAPRTTSASAAPRTTTITSTPSAPTAPADENNAIVQDLQRMLVLMTNVGALIHNPNTSRPSLTNNANYPNRQARDAIIFRTINTLQYNQMPHVANSLMGRISDPAINQQIQRIFDTIVSVISQLNTLYHTPDAQLTAADRINQLIAIKNRYIGSTRVLRQFIRQFQNTSSTATA